MHRGMFRLGGNLHIGGMDMNGIVSIFLSSTNNFMAMSVIIIVMNVNRFISTLKINQDIPNECKNMVKSVK